MTSFAYDAASQLVSVTDPLSRLTSYEYDGLGRNTKITEPDPDGAGGAARPFSTMSYDAVGNLLSVTDPLSHTTSYLYDNLYRQSRITDANSGQTNFSYDKVGNLLTLDDPVGNTTAWTYDGLDRAIEEENELGHSRLFTFDLVGNLVEKTDRNGRITEYDYDNLYRNTTETWIDVPAPEPQLNVSTTTQGTISDEVQQVGISVMGPGFTGGTFTLTYDGQTTAGINYNASAADVQAKLEALSNIAPGDVVVTKTTDTSVSQVWQIAFAGNLADTNVSQTTIDSTNVTVMGMKSNVPTTETAGGTITYEVQTTSLLNANGGTYTLSFQDQTTSPLAWNASAATIDTALEGLSTIDTVNVSGSSGCFSITFTGTHSGQNVPQLSGDDSALENHQNRVLSFEYDAADQLTAAEDPAAEYAYVYDNLGRVTQQTQTIAGLTPSIVLNQKFDAASNRTKLSATIGGTADFKNTYTFDNLNRMTQVIQQANGGNAVAAKRVDFAYNAAGQFTQLKRYEDVGTTEFVSQTDYGYDGMGRLTSLDHIQGGTTLNAYDYTFDAASRITTVTSTLDGLTTYSYDNVNQLRGADNASPRPDETYSFDLNGNRTMSGYVVQANNRTTSDGTYNYEYDNEGNLTKRTKISDGTYEEYTWDHRNRQTKVTFKNASHQVTKTVDQTYDVFNRWVRRSVDADGPGAGAAVDTFFAHDGYQVALEFDGTSAADVSHRYLWGPEVDQILADEQVSLVSQAGNVIYPHGDHLGSARDLVDYNPSTNVASVANHRVYNGFGSLTSETNAAIDHFFGWTGRPFDESTDSQNNVNRIYDHVLGQWRSEDRIGFEAGDTNLRRAVHNNPLSFIDPDGLQERGTLPLPRTGSPAATAPGVGKGAPVPGTTPVPSPAGNLGQMGAQQGSQVDPTYNPGATNQIVQRRLDKVAPHLTQEERDHIASQWPPGTYPRLKDIDDAVKAHDLRKEALGRNQNGALNGQLTRYAKDYAAASAHANQVDLAIRTQLEKARKNKCKDGLNFIIHFGLHELLFTFPNRERHHLNQVAVYGVENKSDGKKNGKIPYDLGYAVSLTKAQHTKVHDSMERWWNQYRKGGAKQGKRPTHAEVAAAHRQALLDAGICKEHAALLTYLAAFERRMYGIDDSKKVDAIPNPIPPPWYLNKKLRKK